MWGDQLFRGLVLFEGSFPPDHLNPGMHHIAHTPKQTERLGSLLWLSMKCFERNNKRVKNLVRNTNRPLSTLANNLQMDIATRFISLSQRPQNEWEEKPPLCILLRRRAGKYKVTPIERYHLAVLGITQFVNARLFSVARILSVHFRAGEWGKQRCGSVITLIYGGRSRYCIVQNFLRVQGRSFARVQWLSIPIYPYYPNLLVVMVRTLATHDHRCVIPVEDIVPCRVAVMPHEDGVHFYMLREKGVDTAPRR